jgi:hypothetical protein
MIFQGISWPDLREGARLGLRPISLIDPFRTRFIAS